MKQNQSFMFSAMIGMVIAIIASFALSLYRDKSQQEEKNFAIKETPITKLTRTSGVVSYADAVNKAAPAVVNIFTSKMIRRRYPTFYNDPLFQQFFGLPNLPQQERVQTGLGSGVIVREDGYIITNHHVISNADQYLIELRDGRKTSAQLIGSDPDTDLALLKININHCPSINFSNSDQLQIGDIVLAIGNPLGVGQTVTMGIISATGRNQLGLNTYENFIQTDAAINSGNSGGALVNAIGDLVGVNSAIFSQSGGSDGIGFAIPSKLVKSIINSIITHGYVIRGWIGASLSELSPELSDYLNIKEDKGLIILSLLRNGPAHQAGLLPGDIIKSINDIKVDKKNKALQMIANFTPDEEIIIDIKRGKKERKVALSVGERPRQ